MISFLIKYQFDQTSSALADLFLQLPEAYEQFHNDRQELILWGDPIIGKTTFEKEIQNADISPLKILETIPGHFYYALLDKVSGVLNIGNSLFAILPLHYSNEGKTVYASDSPLRIAGQTGDTTISKRFILENILFNYQLFDHSCLNRVSLLRTNHCLSLSVSGLASEKLFAIEDHFVSVPKSWKKEMQHIADLFIQRAKNYLPDENYVAALTGGFDGRTLVATSLYYKKQFSTYSFGNNNTSDVSVPAHLSSLAGLKYDRIDLDENYQSSHSLKSGLEFVGGVFGAAGFSRAHYLYAVKHLAQKTNYLITGNFGSEVFRATHNAGAVISHNLYRLMNATNYEDAVGALENAPEWLALNKAEFQTEWLALKTDLKNLPCFHPDHKSRSKNEQFYIFVFNEVFRKYFGAEMRNQFNYLKNRTPFLDIVFLKELLKTELSGVYSDFFTHNPVKRFKGQVVYAHIIRKTYSAFGRELTDKGYCPEDLLTPAGKSKILFSWLRKKIVKEPETEADAYAVSASFKKNKHYFDETLKTNRLFNQGYFDAGVEKAPAGKNSFFIALSQKWWVQQLEEKNYVIREN